MCIIEQPTMLMKGIFAQTYNYKYVYKVRGELVGKGSDGEPLISNPIPVSKLYLTTKLIDHLT